MSVFNFCMVSNHSLILIVFPYICPHFPYGFPPTNLSSASLSVRPEFCPFYIVLHSVWLSGKDTRHIIFNGQWKHIEMRRCGEVLSWGQVKWDNQWAMKLFCNIPDLPYGEQYNSSYKKATVKFQLRWYVVKIVAGGLCAVLLVERGGRGNKLFNG